MGCRMEDQEGDFDFVVVRDCGSRGGFLRGSGVGTPTLLCLRWWCGGGGEIAVDGNLGRGGLRGVFEGCV